MNSLETIKNNLISTPCSVSAWISPQHGFIDFNCGKDLNKTIGFYPDADDDAQIAGNDSVINTLISIQSGLTCSSIVKNSNADLSSSSCLGHSIGLATRKKLSSTLIDDTKLLEKCIYHKYPCLVAKLNVPFHIAEKAWSEVKSFEKGIKFNKDEPCSEKSLDQFKYKIIGSNCIDFMRRIMDSTGISNWKQKMKYYSSVPTMAQKSVALAWHYFNLT